MKLLSITGISRGRNFFFGNSRYTRGMLRYGYCDECLSHETEMAHDRARWITANFITGSGLWLLSLSLTQRLGCSWGGKISCVEGIYEEEVARESSYPRKSGYGSLLALPCYLIVLLVRRDAPSWSRFSPPLPLRPSPFATALAPFLLCHRLAASSPYLSLLLPSWPLDPFFLSRSARQTACLSSFKLVWIERVIKKISLLRSMKRVFFGEERKKDRRWSFLLNLFPPPSERCSFSKLLLHYLPGNFRVAV